MAGTPVNSSHVISTAPTLLVNNNVRQTPGPSFGLLTDATAASTSSPQQQVPSSMAEQQPPPPPQQPPPPQPPLQSTPDPPQTAVQATLNTSSPQPIILANRTNLSQVILPSRSSAAAASPAAVPTVALAAANVSVNTSTVVNTLTHNLATRPAPPIMNGPVRIPIPTSAATNVLTLPPQASGPQQTQQSTLVSQTSQATQMITNQSQPQQVLVSNPGMQQVFLTTRPGQAPQVLAQPRNLAPRHQLVLQNGPALRHPGPASANQRQPMPLPILSQGASLQGVPVTITPGATRAGPSILIKTDQGYQLLNIQSPVQTSAAGIPQMIRFQMPASSATGATHQTLIRTPTGNLQAVNIQPPPQPHAPAAAATTVIRTSTPPVSQPLSVSTTQANAQASSVPNTQMSPSTAKKKCKKFLSTLIKLANDQPEEVSANVKRLIQGLIDGTIPPEDFTTDLQRELRSSDQPCLVPFLKKSLPHLRHSLALGELEIEGVNPPPRAPSTLQIQQTQSTLPQLQFQVSSGARQPIRFVTPMNISSSLNLPGSLVQRAPFTTSANSMSTVSASPATNSAPSTPAAKPTPASKAKAKPRTTSAPKEKKITTQLREDDDINDVAAMGGVNLQEESQRMAASANEVGVQIRSCKDESFLFISNLTSRINRIAAKFSLEETSNDVVSLVSHAAQERLKDLVEKLGIIAEHRLENIKLNPRYETTQDIRAQVKFLEELDKQEKKRHEEQEREMLMRAAKSRSKLEDPEQLKLKQKAKEMQRAEMEEARQREANETALLAIGPRKKMKSTGDNGITQSTSSLTVNSNPLTNHFASPFASTGSSKPIRRVKRVGMKDMLYLMEQDRCTHKSRFLYRAYVK